MDKSTHEIRFTQWKRIIEQCQGRPKEQAAKQWMSDHQINEKSYYYWLRKVRKNAYNQLENTSLPATPEKKSITFAEIPVYAEQTGEVSFHFQASAVIKTNKATIAFSDAISDRLLGRILQEVSYA